RAEIVAPREQKLLDQPGADEADQIAVRLAGRHGRRGREVLEGHGAAGRGQRPDQAQTDLDRLDALRPAVAHAARFLAIRFRTRGITSSAKSCMERRTRSGAIIPKFCKVETWPRPISCSRTILSATVSTEPNRPSPLAWMSS